MKMDAVKSLMKLQDDKFDRAPADYAQGIEELAKAISAEPQLLKAITPGTLEALTAANYHMIRQAAELAARQIIDPVRDGLPSDEEIREQQMQYNDVIRRMEATPKGLRYIDYAAEIDEMIFPTIEVLNSKGYYTAHCCSGHFYENSEIHIIFDPEIKINDFASIPNGFEWENMEHREARELTQEEIAEGYMMQFEEVISVKIFRKIEAGDKYQQFIDVLSSNAFLLQWARELPQR